MKKEIVPNDFIYDSMKKHRFKFLICVLLILAFLIFYVANCYEYMMNVVMGSVPLDEERYGIECADQNFTVREPFKLHRNDSVSIPNYASRQTSYWQDDKYEFDVKLSHVCNTGISYTTEATGGGIDSEEPMQSAIIYSATIGGKETLIIAFPDQKIDDGEVVTGIFTRIPLIMDYDFANSENYKAGKTFSKYMLDVRGLEMESEHFDISFSALIFIILLILSIRLILQYKDYHRTPTYRQLEKYGDGKFIYDWIVRQLNEGYRIDEKRIITEDWILSEDVFKLLIVKNHIKHGSFEYVPTADELDHKENKENK